MGKRKSETVTKERAAVGRERRLALALVAVMDSWDGQVAYPEILDAVNESEAEARTLLAELGYGSLESIPRRVKALNEQLQAAVTAGDGKRIAELGLELERAKAGRLPKEATNGNV